MWSQSLITSILLEQRPLLETSARLKTSQPEINIRYWDEPVACSVFVNLGKLWVPFVTSQGADFQNRNSILTGKDGPGVISSDTFFSKLIAILN